MQIQEYKILNTYNTKKIKLLVAINIILYLLFQTDYKKKKQVQN